MAKSRCASPGTAFRSAPRRHLAIPGIALLFQLLPPVLIGAVARAAYSEPRLLPEAWERPVSLLVLGFSAGVSFLLGSLGAYGLLTRSRPAVAWGLIATCCLPALLGGAVYLQGLLVFLAWV